MTLYSTILSSNNAGGKSVVENWLKDHRFFIGIDEQDVVVSINEDLSLTIRSLGYALREDYYSDKNLSEFYPYLDICITKIPPFGIKEVSGFDKVEFINVIDSDSKLPTIFNDCKTINFSYCRISERYINKIKEILKKNLSKWITYTEVTLEHATLV